MSWRFLLRTKWIVRHAVVAVLVVSMTLLGLWQLRRLDDRRTYNALVASREHLPAAAVQDILPATARVGDHAVTAVLYRSVAARGTYEDSDTVVVENHTLDGRSGGWVLTPMRLPDGSAVVVNRGFIDFNEAGVLVAPPAVAGVVTVRGLVFPSERRGSFGPTDPSAGRLKVLARVDLDRLQVQVGYHLLPAYLQLGSSAPPERPVATGDPVLEPLPAPVLDEGPHFSYAVQWFIFTAIAAGGYPLLLRRVARDQAREEAAATAASLPD